MNNIEIFNNTQNLIQTNPRLYQLTVEAINNTYIIDEGFSVNKQFFQSKEKDAYILFEENLTLRSAAEWVDKGYKTAVLNFANPLEPGGGVLRGANAQEECLCRASNLYNCLASTRVKSYYEQHNDLLTLNKTNDLFLGTDKIIYSPGITFFKEDIGFSKGSTKYFEQVYTEHWRNIDVITCGAPFFRTVENRLPDGDLYHLFCRRIRNIFEAAVYNNIDVLVLGAFGCGAFHNNPYVVANAMRDVMSHYISYFSAIIFPIKRSAKYCENIRAFDIVFGIYPQYRIVSEEDLKKGNIK